MIVKAKRCLFGGSESYPAGKGFFTPQEFERMHCSNTIDRMVHYYLVEHVWWDEPDQRLPPAVPIAASRE